MRTAGGRVVFCDIDFDDTPEADITPEAEIAARRKDLAGRHGAVTRLLAGPPGGKAQRAETPGLERKALEDMARVLCSDSVPGQDKRDLVGGVIDRVVCRPDGADVFFLPGLGAARLQASCGGVDTCNSTLTELMQ